MLASFLQEILRSKQADHSVRWLAAVQFKNTKEWLGVGDLPSIYAAVTIIVN